MSELQILDLRGEPFGRWTVVRRLSALRWECICECGTVRAVLQRSLRNGASQSCGCARRKPGRATRAYGSWAAMHSRCSNPNAADYPRYGGRGIAICERWKSFDAFLADMGERPLGTTLDRIDNDGDYRPDNCRWATPTQQQLNRRSTHPINLGGEIVSLQEAAKRVGRAKTVIALRVAEHGDALRPHSKERSRRRDAA